MPLTAVQQVIETSCQKGAIYSQLLIIRWADQRGTEGRLEHQIRTTHLGIQEVISFSSAARSRLEHLKDTDLIHTALAFGFEGPFTGATGRALVAEHFKVIIEQSRLTQEAGKLPPVGEGPRDTYAQAIKREPPLRRSRKSLSTLKPPRPFRRIGAKFSAYPSWL